MAKHSNGLGGIRRRKDGRYEARYTVETAMGAKRKTIYGKDYDEVAEKLIEALANRNKGLIFDAGNLTVGEYLDRWLQDSVRDTVKRRTFETYRFYIAKHLTPAIGRVKLSKLTPAHVQGLYRAKLDSGLSPTTVNHMHGILRTALKRAVMWGLIPRNVTEAVSVPRRAAPDINPLTPEQARRLLSAASQDPFEALYVLSLTTGIRQGEALGLRWRDVDLKRWVIYIRQTLATGFGKQTFEKPKTAKSRRSVHLTSQAVEALTAHGEGQRAAQRPHKASDGLVFTNRDGGPVHPKNLIDRHFQPLLKRAGLPMIRWHDLRHTAATLLLSKGIHAKIVSEMLGHATISVTLDTYSHVLPSMQAGAVNAMSDLLDEKEPGE